MLDRFVNKISCNTHQLPQKAEVKGCQCTSFTLMGVPDIDVDLEGDERNDLASSSFSSLI